MLPITPALSEILQENVYKSRRLMRNKRKKILPVFQNHCRLVVSDEWVSREALVVKNPPPNAGDLRGTVSIPGWGRSPGGGYGDPL